MDQEVYEFSTATGTFMIFNAVRKSHTTNFHNTKVLSSLILVAIFTFGGWCDIANATPLSVANMKTLKNETKVNCIKATQEDRKIYNQVYLWNVEDYCECCATASSQALTLEELSYFESNQSWPEGVIDRNRDIGFKCMEQVTNKQ